MSTEQESSIQCYYCCANYANADEYACDCNDCNQARASELDDQSNTPTPTRQCVYCCANRAMAEGYDGCNCSNCAQARYEQELEEQDFYEQQSLQDYWEGEAHWYNMSHS
jgi:hypothetical protein